MHVPRQTGKTTCMLALMEHLNREGRYKALYCNVEAAQAAREDVAQAMNDILREMAAKAQIYLQDDFLDEERDRFLTPGGHGTAIAMSLRAWSEKSDKPLVAIFDEVDSLVGDSLISFLRQIRSGYTQPSRGVVERKNFSAKGKLPGRKNRDLGDVGKKRDLTEQSNDIER